jgi:deoxyribodipyrimidine photolyase-related protein
VVGPRLVLVLGDQLSAGLSALRAADPARDVVVMAEVMVISLLIM